MKRLGSIVLLCGVVGLVVGYLIFGRMGNSYVAISTLITGSENILQRAARRVTGIDEMRRNILLMGAGGAVLGLVASGFAPGGRRRR
ncbi:MAG: hypothetical protein ACOC28_03695 [Alkalispirochaetaceae bacterium]